MVPYPFRDSWLGSNMDKHKIVEDLKSLGLKEDMSIEVHSSLSSFGHIDGGAETVIDALMDVVGSGGAIVMPSFRMSKRLPLNQEDRSNGLTCKIRILENSEEHSGMGIISDTFRKREDVTTGEGLFRVSAWGKDRDKNSASFSNLIEKDEWALLLGVDIYSLSTMHYVESYLPEEISKTFRAPEELLLKYNPEEWYIETGEPPVKAWYKIQDEAIKNNLITIKNIGRAQCMFFKINNVIELYKKALQEDPYELYGFKED